MACPIKNADGTIDEEALADLTVIGGHILEGLGGGRKAFAEWSRMMKDAVGDVFNDGDLQTIFGNVREETAARTGVRQTAATADEAFVIKLGDRIGLKGAAGFVNDLVGPDGDTTLINKIIKEQKLTADEERAVYAAMERHKPKPGKGSPATGAMKLVQDAVAKVKEEIAATERANKKPPTAEQLLDRHLAAAFTAEGRDKLKAAIGPDILKKLANDIDLDRAETVKLTEALKQMPARKGPDPNRPITFQDLREAAREAKRQVAQEQHYARLEDFETRKAYMRESLIEGMDSEKLKRFAVDMLNVKDGDMAGLDKVFRKYVPVDVWGLMSSMWKSGLLTSPATHVRNLGGGALMHAFEEASRMPAAMADTARLAVAKATGQTALLGDGRRILGPDVDAMARASKAAATRGVSEAWSLLKKGYVKNDLFDHDSELAKMGFDSDFVSRSKVLNGYVNGVFRALSAEDRINRVYAFARSIEEQAKIAVGAEISQMRAKGQAVSRDFRADRLEELRREPPEWMQAEAIARAEEATFNNPNVLHNAVQQARRTLGKGRVVLDYFAPFVRTPSNIFGRVMEYSFGTAIGPARAAAQVFHDVRNAREIAEGVVKQAFTPAEQRKFAETVGRGSVGLAMMAMGYKLAEKELLTGFNSGDEQRQARNRTGRPDGSILWNGRSYSLKGIQPASSMLLLGATLYEQTHPKAFGVEPNAVGAAFGTIGAVAQGHPLAQGQEELTETIEGLKTPEGQRRIVGRGLGSAVPNVVAAAAGQLDDVRRKKSSVGDYVKERIPGMRTTLPPLTDIQGRPIPDATGNLLDPTSSAPLLPKTGVTDLYQLLGELQSYLDKPARTPEDFLRQKAARRMLNELAHGPRGRSAAGPLHPYLQQRKMDRINENASR